MPTKKPRSLNKSQWDTLVAAAGSNLDILLDAMNDGEGAVADAYDQEYVASHSGFSDRELAAAMSRACEIEPRKGAVTDAAIDALRERLKTELKLEF